ncbi:MAG: hypothetical protein M0Q51_14455, partial [Bacteroidales bacterium]|nr:hypothetical protein [Bacteroidales bacterium]
FGFPVARDTLAFGYKIPAITALFGLGGVYPRTIEIYYMPGTPLLYLLRRIRRRRSGSVKATVQLKQRIPRRGLTYHGFVSLLSYFTG